MKAVMRGACVWFDGGGREARGGGGGRLMC